MTRPVPDLTIEGQESVWSYPRPAIAEPCRSHLVVVLDGRIIADTRSGVRTLETSHPPVYYFPRGDVAADVLRSAGGSSFCEWKGVAKYLDVVTENAVRLSAAWFYEDPAPGFELLRGFVAFYAGPMDACLVDDELVVPQPGGFYGGWITKNLAGPFKGGPGSAQW